MTPLLIAAAFAQTAPPDSPTTQALLIEIRHLRQDLQNAAVTIQRVQIVMYRLQAQTAQLNRATQRLDEARERCSQAREQRKMLSTQIEQTEARQRNPQNPLDQKAAEEFLVHLKSSVGMWASMEQQCQTSEVDADAQFRAEQTKNNELQDQLDKLDRILAGYGAK